MRPLILLTVTLFLFSLFPAATPESATRWHTFNKGMALAKKLNRPVLVDFYAQWCQWCRTMDRRTFSDPAVAAYLKKHFIAIRIDTEDRQEKITWQGRS